jgi:transcriptional regulator with XRE-family HTH domain
MVGYQTNRPATALRTGRGIGAKEARMEGSPFGRYIRDQRMKERKSLREVAGELGVSHVYLAEVERGVRGPLTRERWPVFVKAVPSATMQGLERAAVTTRPLQISLEDAPPQYRDLALALARRIEKQDLGAKELHKVLAILGRGEKG